jgi:hypothetical protein
MDDLAAEGDKSTVNQDEAQHLPTTGQVSQKRRTNAALRESSGGVFGDKAFLDFGEWRLLRSLTDEDSRSPSTFKNMPPNSDYTALPGSDVPRV